MYNLGLIFLGDASIDGRCINMLRTASHKYKSVFLIHTGKSNIKIIDNVHIFKIDLSKIESGFLKYYTFHKEIIKKLKTISAKILIASDLYSLPAIAMQTSKTKKIFDSREIYSQLAGLKNKPLKQFFWSNLEKYFIKKVDIVIVTAKMDKNYLRNLYGDLDIDIIYNFPSKFFLNVKNNILREKLKLNKNQIIFLYQGVIHNHRGIRKMIHLLKFFKDAVVVIIGAGDALIEITKYVNDEKLNDRVYFIGTIPYSDLLNFTICADIGFALIQPVTESYEQALPNKLFEYGICGVPVIASKFPEMNNFIKKYNLGEAVEPSNDKDHIRAVKKILLENKKKSVKSSNLIWENQAENFLKIIC